MAYGEVTLKPAVMMTIEGEYENPDKILKPSDQWNEATAASNYETIDTSKQPAIISGNNHASTHDYISE